jgi:drug/metabolite transporter (DMT)-like permease
VTPRGWSYADAPFDPVGLAAVLAASIALATGPIAGKWAYAAGVDPTTLLALRMGLAAVVMWLFYALVWRESMAISLPGLVACLAVAAANTTAMLLYFHGLRYVDAGLTSLVFYLYPALVLLLLVPLGQPLTVRRGLRLALALAGLYPLVNATLGNASVFGIGLVLIAAVAYAAYLVLSEWALQAMPSRTVALYVITAMAGLLMLVGATRGAIDLRTIPASGWWAVLLLALLTTVAARLLLFAGMRRIGSGRAALIGVAEPVAVVVMAAFFLGERLTPGQALGGALILMSLLLARGSSH